MFQFPRCPPAETGASPSREAGCPIRTPPDHRLPAPPRGVSPRGRVLPRPTTPRHPPCAHLRDHYDVTNALHPQLEASGARPTRARGTEIPQTTPSTLPASCKVVQDRKLCGARGRGSTIASKRPRPRGLGGLTHQVVNVPAGQHWPRDSSEACSRAEDGASTHPRGHPSRMRGDLPRDQTSRSRLRWSSTPPRRPCRLHQPRSREGGTRNRCPGWSLHQPTARPGSIRVTPARAPDPSLERR